MTMPTCFTRRRSLKTSLVLALLAAGSVPGCGRGFPTARLEGAVTVDGQPVEQGNLSFVSIEGDRGPGSAAVIAGGRYVANDVPEGKVRVYFNATKETGGTIEQFGKQYPETVDVIPEKYRGGLEIEIAGDAERDFDLRSE